MNSLWGLTWIVKNKSPSRPFFIAFPPPLTLRVWPLSIPAGIFTLIFSLLDIIPSPSQRGQSSSGIFPFPLQSSHSTTLLIIPQGVFWVILTLPWPLQFEQISNFLSFAPVPLHKLQNISFFIEISFSHPYAASSKDIVISYCKFWPMSWSSSPNWLPKEPFLNKSLNISDKSSPPKLEFWVNCCFVSPES